MQRTVSIPVTIPEEVMLPLLKVCSQVFNTHAEWAYNSGTYNKNKAHQDLYEELKVQHPDFPTGYLQTIRDNAMEATKAFWKKQKDLEKRKKSKSYRPSKNSRKNPNREEKLFPVRSETSSLRLDRRTCTLRGEQFSFSTLGKRHKVLLSCPNYFKPVYDTWKFQAATIIYLHKKDSFVVRLVFKTDTPAMQAQEPATVNALGIDRGIKNICAFSDGTKISGVVVNAARRKYLFVRKTLQEKGTPSAKRRLKAISGKEQRFIRDVNHCVTKQIAGMPYDYFVLEKLTGIRNKDKGRKQNKRLSNWSYFQQELFLAYKLEAVGKRMEYVDARYTSQKCCRCGHTAKGNRSGGVFKCGRCGHKMHSDLNAAFNIRDSFLSRHQYGGQGVCQAPTMQMSLGSASRRASPGGT